VGDEIEGKEGWLNGSKGQQLEFKNVLGTLEKLYTQLKKCKQEGKLKGTGNLSRLKKQILSTAR